MSKFVTGKQLEEVVYDIIFNAEKNLLIVSPFIKLDKYFKALFDNHSQNPNLHIVIVFGKNEFNIERSFSKEDFEYFKKFPNISVIYVSTLHGKYYANEKMGVITSINLLDYSFKNNIEFGIKNDFTFIDSLKNSADQEAWSYCNSLAETSDVVFAKRPKFEKKLFGLSRNYLGSEVLCDLTQALAQGIQYQKIKLGDFPPTIEVSKSLPKTRPKREEIEKKAVLVESPSSEKTQSGIESEAGFCIRCSKSIPYNMIKPLCYSCYQIWNQYKNPDYQETFCHACGTQKGEISLNKPYCSGCFN